MVEYPKHALKTKCVCVCGRQFARLTNATIRGKGNPEIKPRFEGATSQELQTLSVKDVSPEEMIADAVPDKGEIEVVGKDEPDGYTEGIRGEDYWFENHTVECVPDILGNAGRLNAHGDKGRGRYSTREHREQSAAWSGYGLGQLLTPSPPCRTERNEPCLATAVPLIFWVAY